jgi:uncharacterized protein (DUF58 family)
MRLRLRDYRLPVLIVAAFLFAWFAGGRFPYFLLWLGLGVTGGALLWTAYGLRKVVGEWRVNRQEAAVGEPVELTLRLENDGILPLPWLELDDETPSNLVASDAPKQATHLPLLGSRILRFTIRPKRRGFYQLGPVRLRLGDGLSVAQGERVIGSPVRLTVYPRIVPIESLDLALGLPFGPVRTRERAFEDPSNQSEIRPYRPGDNPRQIHWKTTARRGELMLREYELNAAASLLVIPDLQAGAPPEASELAIELSASLTAWAIRQRLEVGLISHGAERIVAQPSRGERSYREILEGLTRAEASGVLPLSRVLEQESALFGARTTLAVITARIDHHLVDALLRLRPRHPIMLFCLDGPSFGAPFALDHEILHLLARKRITIFILPAEADLRHLDQYRLYQPEGVTAL